VEGVSGAPLWDKPLDKPGSKHNAGKVYWGGKKAHFDPFISYKENLWPFSQFLLRSNVYRETVEILSFQGILKGEVLPYH
jgi:hypothetical protein